MFCCITFASYRMKTWYFCCYGSAQNHRRCLIFSYLLFLLLAGEMSHHDVLDAASQGISVILCEHSNTERGFLSDLRDMLDAHLENKINIILSETDRDPLHVI